ncbi:hypothetical protein AAHH80_33345, partial [Burkholderia pseudomallei]
EKAPTTSLEPPGFGTRADDESAARRFALGDSDARDAGRERCAGAMPATAAKPAAANRHSRGPGPALASERLAPPSRRTVSLGRRIARAQ